MTRLPNSEIEFYENILANIRAITEAVRRLVYEAGESPEVMAEVARIAENAALIKKRTIQQRSRRKES